MDGLLLDLDDSFWNAVPTPDPSPKKSVPSHLATPKRLNQTRNQSSKPLKPIPAAPSPSKVFSAGDVDLTALLEGAEDWNWDDLDSDLLTPKKSPRKVQVRNLFEVSRPTNSFF